MIAVNARILVLSIVAAAALADCSRSPASVMPPASTAAAAVAAASTTASVATGTLTIVVPQSVSESVREVAYISTATKQAALFIDGLTTAAGSSTSCSSGCTIAYKTTAGTHTLRAEIANGSSVVLAEGSASVTVVPGAGNNFTMTLNGAAAIASWESTTSTTTSSISGTYAIEDSSSVPITSAGGSTTFDNAPIAFLTSVSPTFSGTASFTTSGSSTTLSAPDAHGTDYPFTASCSASANGTFTVTATSASSSAGITAGQLSGVSVSYPSSTLNVAAMHTYSCASGTIADASVLALDGGTENGCSGVSSCAATLTTSDTNDVIIVYCQISTSGGVFSTPTAAGLTFTQRGTTFSNGENRTEGVWYAVASSAISKSIVCNWTGSQMGQILAFAVNGANTTSPFDTNASLPYYNAGFPVAPSCTISTSNANDFIYTIAINNGEAVPGPGGSFSSSIVTGYAYYDIVSAVQTNLTIAWSGSGRYVWACDAIAAAGT